MDGFISKRKLTPNKWVDNYSDELFKFILLRVNDLHTAEDILQDTFFSAFRSKETYKGEASEKNWLFAICKNNIIDYFRKKSKTYLKLSLNELDIYFDEDGQWKNETRPKSWENYYEEPSILEGFEEVLTMCRKKLNKTQDRIFVMKYLDESTPEFICQTLNISSANYWVLIHRCKLNLRSCLEKNWLKI